MVQAPRRDKLRLQSRAAMARASRPGAAGGGRAAGGARRRAGGRGVRRAAAGGREETGAGRATH
jgi:hypothetical protein